MLIADIEKNTRERVRVTIEEYRGHKFIDCRVYYRDEAGEWQPTRKGIALNADTLNDVIAALQKGSDALGSTLSPIVEDGKARPAGKPVGTGTVSEAVRAWVLSSVNDQFSVKDSQRALGLTERKQAHLVNVVLSQMCNEGLIERTGQGRGVYRKAAAGRSELSRCSETTTVREQ